MSTHNICFHEEIRKIFICIMILSGVMAVRITSDLRKPLREGLQKDIFL